MSDFTVCCLGRFGDVVNALPIAREILAKTKCVPDFVISKQFASILDGVSYVNPKPVDLDYSRLPEIIPKLPNMTYIAQTYKNPDNRRKTPSYQIESWRCAGWDHLFDELGYGSGLFDKRSPEREAELVKQHVKDGVVNVCVAGVGVSSPIKYNLVEALSEFPVNLVDFSKIKAERIYDLIGIMDACDLLVTIDTAHYHLSRDSKTKVVALCNDGWYGSVRYNNVFSRILYSTAKPAPMRWHVKRALGDKIGPCS